jgi:hypothetical protein
VRELPPQATVEFFGNIRGDLSMLTALVDRSEVLSLTADGQCRNYSLAPLFRVPLLALLAQFTQFASFCSNRCC